MIYGLILAGGKGSRLYHLSRKDDPKQFLKLINDKSFLIIPFKKLPVRVYTSILTSY